MTTWFWYRVYAREGQRLIVRALNGFDAKYRANLRWRRAGLTASAVEVREATPEEIERHLVSVARFEGLWDSDNAPPRAVFWPRRAAGGGR